MRTIVGQSKFQIKKVSSILRSRFGSHDSRKAKSSLWSTAKALGIGVVLSFVPLNARAVSFTYNVTLSTAITNQASFGATLIANLTSYYVASVTPSIFFTNAWNVNIVGINPKYIPPPPPVQPKTVSFDTTTFQTDLDFMIKNSSDTYLNGWVDGQAYERQNDTNLIYGYVADCQVPADFTLVVSTTNNFHWPTCQDSLMTVGNAIFQQNLSTPTVIPGF